MRKPPIGGPSAVVTAEAAAQVPIALPRMSLGKLAEMIARLCGTSSAAPMPWSVRAAISSAALGATAQSSEATVKATMPDQEDAAAADAVAEPAADQDQRAQHQQIGVGHPLHRDDVGREILLDRRHGDADHGRIDEGHGRGDDRRGEHIGPRLDRTGVMIERPLRGEPCPRGRTVCGSCRPPRVRPHRFGPTVRLAVVVPSGDRRRAHEVVNNADAIGCRACHLPVIH